MLSQFCRKCKGNYAEYSKSIWDFHVENAAFLLGILSHLALTTRRKWGILPSKTLLSQEVISVLKNAENQASIAFAERKREREQRFPWVNLIQARLLLHITGGK